MTFAVGEVIVLSVGQGGGTLIITVINGGAVASNDTILLNSTRSWIDVVSMQGYGSLACRNRVSLHCMCCVIGAEVPGGCSLHRFSN